MKGPACRTSTCIPEAKRASTAAQNTCIGSARARWPSSTEPGSRIGGTPACLSLVRRRSELRAALEAARALPAEATRRAVRLGLEPPL